MSASEEDTADHDAGSEPNTSIHSQSSGLSSLIDSYVTPLRHHTNGGANSEPHPHPHNGDYTRPAALASKLELLGYRRSDTESALKSSIEMLINSVTRGRRSPSNICGHDFDELQQQRKEDRTTSMNTLLNLMEDLCDEAVNFSEACEALSAKEERTAENLVIVTSELQRLTRSSRDKKCDDGDNDATQLLKERTTQLEQQISHLNDELANERRTASGRDGGGNPESLLLSRDPQRESQQLIKELGDAKKQITLLQSQLNLKDATIEREVSARCASEANERKLKDELSQRVTQISHLNSRNHQHEKENIDLNLRLEQAPEEAHKYKELYTKEKTCSDCLRQQIATANEEMRTLRTSLEEMDANRDALEAQLDEITGELQTKESMVEDATKRVKMAEASAMNVDGRSEEIRQALISKEREVSSMRQTIQSMEMDQKEIRAMLDIRDHDLMRANRDLAAMTSESQAVSVETSRLMGELSDAKSRLDECLQRADRAEGKHRALELEKNDLLANYRAVVDERTKLEQGMQELAHARHQLSRTLQLSQEDNQRLKAQCAGMQEEIRKRSSGMVSFERHLDGISRQNLALQRKLEAAESENRRLRINVEASKQATGRISHQTYELQRTSAESRQEVEVMKSSLVTLEAGRNSLQRMLSEERTRGEGIESLLASIRVNEAAAADQIRKLAKENAELSTKLNEALMRLGDPPNLAATTAMSSLKRTERFAHGGAMDVTQSPISQKSNNHETPSLAAYLEQHIAG